MATGRPHPANTHKGEEGIGPGIHLTHNSTREDNAKAGVAGESTQPATDAKMFMRIMNKRHVRAAIAACFSAAQDRTPSLPLPLPFPLSLLSFCGRCIEICWLPGAGSQSIASAIRNANYVRESENFANCKWRRTQTHTLTHAHTYGCKQMHPHKQLNSWPNCWCALITHTPHVPSSSLVCHNCQLATSICARSRLKYAFALSTQLVSFLITVVNKYTTQFGAHRH